MLGSQFSMASVLDEEHLDDTVIPDVTHDWFAKQHAGRNVLQRSPGAAGVPLSASVFNLLNATVAAGTLGLPLAFSLTGYGLAVAALTVMALVNVATSMMLVRVATAEGTQSYDSSVRQLLGTGSLVRWGHARHPPPPSPSPAPRSACAATTLW